MTLYESGKRLKNGASKPGTWTIYYEHDQQHEKINLAAFAAGLSLAHERGCKGPDPFSQPVLQRAVLTDDDDDDD